MNSPADSSTIAPRAELVGRGMTADVYAWGDGRVLKLFHPGRPLHAVEREYRVTRAVRAAGVPAPDAFEVVEVGGRWGIVFARVDGPSLLRHVQSRPWAVFDAVRRLAELQARIHRCAAPAGLPSQHERVTAGIDAAPGLSADDRRAAHARLAELPDGAALCHGDFHPENVLLTDRGPMVIDWGGATRGHPLGDVAVTARLMRTAALPPWAPAHAHLMMRCFRPALHRSYLKWYFRQCPGPRREVEGWQVPLAAAFRSRPVPAARP